MRFRLLYILGLLVAVFIGFLVGRIQPAPHCLTNTKNSSPYNVLLGLLRNEVCEFDYSLDDKPLRDLALKLEDFPSGMELTGENTYSPESAAVNYADPTAALELFKRTNRLDSYKVRYTRGSLLSYKTIGIDNINVQITHTRTPSQAHELFNGWFKNFFEHTGGDVPASMILVPLKNVDETKSFVVESYSCTLTDESKAKCTDVEIYFRRNNLIERLIFSSNAKHVDLAKITEWAQKAADRLGR
jgi:hypothetical protein